MTPIRRLALTVLVALFIALGTAAPIAAAGHPVHPERCIYEPWQCKEH